MFDISAILANPSAFGFKWEAEPVKSGDVTLDDVPVLVVTDVSTFEDNFPGRIAASLDGSSFRVISQRVGRDARVKDHGAKMDALKVKVLNAILGLKVKVTTPVYAMPDGTTTTDLAAFKDAWGITE